MLSETPHPTLPLSKDTGKISSSVTPVLTLHRLFPKLGPEKVGTDGATGRTDTTVGTATREVTVRPYSGTPIIPDLYRTTTVPV